MTVFRPRVPGADGALPMCRVRLLYSGPGPPDAVTCSHCRSRRHGRRRPFSSGLLKKALWQGRREFERRGGTDHTSCEPFAL